MEQMLGRPTGPVLHVCFPSVRASVLENLNRQREEGQLCDLSIQVQGQVFRAHRCVLAASSPYFHDQVLLKNVTTVSLPSVMDPLAFESVLASAYTGQLSIVRDDIVNYVTVASFLQMWHIVDKCTDILKRSRPLAQVSPGGATSSSQQSPSSSDCCFVDAEERGAGEQTLALEKKSVAGEHAALPPLATWRRPHQPQGRWGRNSLSVPLKAASPRPDGIPAGGDHSCSVVPLTPGVAGDNDTDLSARHRVRARLRGPAESRDRGAREEEERRRTGERWMEADEGVGELLEEEKVRVKYEEHQGGVESGGSLRERECGESEQEVSHLSEIDPHAQWHHNADWPTGLCAQSDGKLSNRDSAGRAADEDDAEEDEMDIGRFADGGFETYDEIEEATGQVSQRPLLQASPDDFAPGPSELSWAQTVSPISQSSSLPPSSSPPITSPSSPLSGTPYTGKVHYCHCGKAYTLKSMRDRHVKMQHLNLRPFACPVCSKSFKMKHHLTKHVKTHGSLRPYECAFCGKKIVWRDSFLKHQARCQRLTAAASASVTVEVGREAADELPSAGGAGQVKVEQDPYSLKEEKTSEY